MKATILLLTFLVLTGCASLINKKPPAIAHIHIGHAMTGWVDTPNRAGLLIIAEQESAIALANAELMGEYARDGDLQNTVKAMQNIANAVNPNKFTAGDGKGYGLCKATKNAVSHMRFASESPDASVNVLRSTARMFVFANKTIEQCNELETILEYASDIREAPVLAGLSTEVVQLVQEIAGGIEGNPNNYGLFELRTDIEAMIAREDPPYKTADSWFLFNLVQLPDGAWGFAKGRRKRGSGGGY